jgi:hypothetical protein
VRVVARIRVLDEKAIGNVEIGSLDAIDKVVQEAGNASRTRSRPRIPRGLLITDYSPLQLVQLIRWIESDDRLRTENELITETMLELGFRKRGSRIVTAISHAIRQARS